MAAQNNHQYINEDSVVNLVLALGEDDLDQLTRVLSQNQSLKTINIKGSLKSLNKIIPIIAKIPTLEELLIESNQCVSSVLRFLTKCQNLRWLSFPSLFDYTFAQHLASFLKTDPSVQEIILKPISGNILSDYHYSIINEGVKMNTRLRSLKGYTHLQSSKNTSLVKTGISKTC